MDFTGNLSRIKITSKILFDLMKYKTFLNFFKCADTFCLNAVWNTDFCILSMRIENSRIYSQHDQKTSLPGLITALRPN